MLINVCLWSKRATSYRIYESQNGLSELLQASYITAIKTDSHELPYMLYGSQHGLAELV